MFKKLLIVGLVVAVLGAGSVFAYDLLRGDSTLAYEGGRVPAVEAAGIGRGYGARVTGDAGQATIGAAPTGAPVGDVPGLANGAQIPQPQAQVTEWITVQGTVTAVDLNALMIKTDSGEMMAVQLGPEHYWTAQGIALAAGDEVEITGFYEDGTTLNAGSVTLVDAGETLALRESDGRPLWAGGPGAGQGGAADRPVVRQTGNLPDGLTERRGRQPRCFAVGARMAAL